MVALLAKSGRLDRFAIGLSGLCIVHCLATAVLLAALSSIGGLLGAPVIHEVALVLAMLMGAFALGQGVVKHGFMMPCAVGALGLGVMAGALQLPHDGSEALLTMVGVGILALGHRLNSLAAD
ncbi:MAG: MerC domain-containing protein [Sphingomonas sp.]|nr:MerC domain-containing protein [Sphingomonas sp.]